MEDRAADPEGDSFEGSFDPGEDVRILLVDDRPDKLIALEAVLETPGQTIIKATSGEEALRLLLREDFAVILLDISMPGMDGFETAAMIRQRPRTEHTPIIFVTSINTNETHVTRGYSLGAVDYIFSPVEPSILKTKVSVFIDLYRKSNRIKQQAEQLRQVAERRAAGLEQRLDELLNQLNIGVFGFSSNGQLVEANHAFLRILKVGNLWQARELDLSPLREVFESVAITPAHLNGNCVGYDVKNIELQVTRRDGETVWLSVNRSAQPSQGDGAIEGMVEDITERKHAEREREEALKREQEARQEAERANKSKDEFLSTLSHELRNPLNAILGWCRLLQRSNGGQFDDAKALEIIERNARMQIKIISDLLDLSAVISGKVRLDRQTISFADVVEMALAGNRATAETNKVQILTSLSPEFAAPITGDQFRLQQVVSNLLSNAIKFTPSGGMIEVRGTREGARLRLQVRDTGEGITPQFLPLVFERFRQADSSSTRRHGGLGLGLSIVKQLVELHEGTVSAYSDGTGKGACFIVDIPANDPSVEQSSDAIEAEKNSSNQESQDPSFAGIRVLIVDDEPDALSLMQQILGGYGAEVLTASCAEDAVRLFIESRPNILISDIAMPNQDGYMLIKRVRELRAEAGDRVLAVAVTAFAAPESRAKALSSGYQWHVAKPIEPQQFAGSLFQLWQSRRHTDSCAADAAAVAV